MTEKQSRNNQRKKSQRKWQFYHRLQKYQLALLYLNSFHMDAFLIKKGFGTLKEEDYRYIHWALEVTGMTEFANRPAEALSGGQRQRVWIAMALAQGTELLVLDEPTTYLDMAHQLEVLNLLKKLNEEEGRTIVMVIHDLNHASRFSDHMIALKAGKLMKQGTPDEVMTSETLRNVFEIEAQIVPCPVNCKPICLTYDLAMISNQLRKKA
ncbi:ABC transporter ATP-binding protein [Bacillus paranthracis]